MQLATALAEDDDDPLREVVGASTRRVSRFSLFKRASMRSHVEFILTGRSRAWLREFFDVLPGNWVVREHKATKELARNGTTVALYLVQRKEGSARGTDVYRSLTRALKLGERLRVELEILREYAPGLLAVSAMLGEAAEAERVSDEVDAEIDEDVGDTQDERDARIEDGAFAKLVQAAQSADDIVSNYADANADSDPYGDDEDDDEKQRAQPHRVV